MKASGNNCAVSFIVPAHNETSELPATLCSIRHAAETVGCEYETVVVDDASRDDTADLARKLGARVVSISRRQIAAARNAGARAASGDVFVFVDADTHIAPEHVGGVIEALHRGDAGGGARVRVGGEVPRWARLALGLFSFLYFGMNFGAGAFLFTRRETFFAIGGFDERYFAGEELFFTMALRRRGRFTLLQKPVITSGRKLRIYSAGEVARQVAAILFSGPRAITSRRKLELWYGGAREERP
jgi:glycosyltransferase involved in cell wall biosynthesis